MNSMTPVELRDSLRASGRYDEADIVDRMAYALKIVLDSLCGQGLDALRDGQGLDALRAMSPRQCAILADMCRAAITGEPHEAIDDAIGQAAEMCARVYRVQRVHIEKAWEAMGDD